MQLASPAQHSVKYLPKRDTTTAASSSSLREQALTHTYGLILYGKPSIPGVLQLLQGFIVMQWKYLNHDARCEQPPHCGRNRRDGFEIAHDTLHQMLPKLSRKREGLHRDQCYPACSQGVYSSVLQNVNIFIISFGYESNTNRCKILNLTERHRLEFREALVYSLPSTKT